MSITKQQAIENKILLIFGMPRSGTTWLGKIFDSHPDTLYLHEPDTEIQIDSVPRLVTNNNYSKYTGLINQYCSHFLDKCAIRINGKFPFFKKSYLSCGTNIFFKFNLMVAKLIGKFNMIFPIWNPFKSNSIDNSLIIWKSIESCGRMGLIMNALPESKAIYIIRHPCGQIASVINGEEAGRFSSNVSNADDFKLFESLLQSKYAIENKLTIEQIKAMSPVERLSIRWVLYNEHAIEDIEKSGLRARVVRYEDICKDTEKEIKKLFEFSGLSWEGQTEKFVEKSTLGDSKAYYSVFKNPEIAVSKWKEQLTDKDISIIKKIVSKSKVGALFSESF